MLKEVLKKAKRPLVVSDFDGTISTRDISYEVLLRFSKGGWEDIDQAYVRGEIGSKEAFSLILEKIPAKKSELASYIEELAGIDPPVIDPHFKAFYDYLKARKIDFIVLSDGFHFYIKTLLERAGIDGASIFANDIGENPSGKLVPLFPHHNEECDRCGNCKTKVIKEFLKDHDYVIFIGDGYSDTCPSELADTLFAKRSLYQYAVRERIPCIHFRRFDDILAEFEKDIRGVIFDLDGTLVESLDAIKTAFVYTLETLHIEIDTEAAFKKLMHWPLTVSMEKLFPDVNIETLIGVFRKKYYEIYKDMTPLKDGMKDILEGLKSSGVRLSVATNKHGPYARELIEHLEIADYFIIVVGAGDVEKPKPHPDMIEAACGNMGTDLSQTILIGDSLVDVETAKNAGIDAYALSESLDTPEELAEKRPKKLFFNTRELSRELLSHKKDYMSP